MLRGQVDSASAIRSFARDLSLFTGTLAGSDADVRRLIDNGSATANQLRTFLEDNRVDLGQLINNAVTTGDVIVKHLPGIAQILVIYPYVVEGGFTVVSKSPDTGLYDAHFGLIITDNPVCHHGYEGTDTRPPQDGSNRPMNVQRRLPGARRPEQPAGTAEPVQNSCRLSGSGGFVRPRGGQVRWGARVDPRWPSRARWHRERRRGLMEVAVAPALTP